MDSFINFDAKFYLDSPFKGKYPRVLLGTQELVNVYFPHATKGSRADGQVIWFNDGIAIFEHMENFDDLEVDISVPTEIPVKKMSVDKFYDLRLYKVYSKRHLNKSYQDLLFNLTTAGKVVIKEKEVKELNRVIGELVALGVEVSEETLNLHKQIEGFDYYYDYSDDHRYAMKTRQRERDLDAAIAVYPGLVSFKATKYKS